MPISNGNTWLEFDYNSVTYTLPYVNVTGYESKPVFAEDGHTMQRYEVSLQGTALVSDGTSTFTDLATKFRNGTGTVERFRLRVTSSGGTSDVVDISFPDAMRGPYLSLNVSEISGRRAAIVSFTASGSISQQGANGTLNPNYPVLSHRWTSRVQLDANGNPTRTVTGSVTVDLGAGGSNTTAPSDGTTGSISGKKPWADLFRRSILPAIASMPGLWRRQSQTFAYNDAGNSMIYEITDEQVRTDLPDEAFSGNAEFTYERTRQNAMARLEFNCDLEGQVNGDVRNLIWAAVVLAQTRISFVKSLITRLVVRESEMLSKAKIRLEIEAQTPAVGTDTPSSSQICVPLAQLVGKYFSVSRTCDWYADPFGPQGLGMAQIPHWNGNSTTGKPDGINNLAVADVVAVLVADCPAGTPTTSFLGDATDFTAANAQIAVGPFNTQTADFQGNDQIATVERSFTTTAVVQNARMHRLQTLYTQGADFVFQAGKAAVIIEETTTVKRVNNPPNRVFRPMPPGCILLSDEWRVNHGEVDAAGNRTFTGVYVRKLMTYDLGGATYYGYYTQSNRRQWWNTTVAAPLTLGFDQTSQQTANNVLAVTGSQSYSTGTAQDFVST
jgi:hypothetical protein